MLPLSYLVVAAAAFVPACAGVPALAGELAGHYYHPRVVALTHTVTLGWITLAIMGASYQLIPIVLGRPVWRVCERGPGVRSEGGRGWPCGRPEDGEVARTRGSSIE